MKALVLLSLAVLFLASGCSDSTFYWYHPNRTLEEANADYTQCWDEAREKAADVISGKHYDRLPPPSSSSTKESSPRDRIVAAPDDAQGAWRDQYEQSVVADCMRARGYMKLTPDRVPRDLHTKKYGQSGVAGR
jgi:hypothetical protein